MTPIRWDRIAQAIRFYEELGYSYLEVPWVVSEEALSATLPPGHEATRCQDGPLVGSAEQSFMHLMLQGTMPVGRFIAATPCFRDDPEDELHQRRFFKVELIHYYGPGGFLGSCPDMAHAVSVMTWDALAFFASVGAAEAVSTAMGDFTCDIELGGIEIGSYGFRRLSGAQHLGDHAWVYGTGLAEPRFSIALKSSGPGMGPIA